MHSKDKLFIENSLKLFNTDVDYKTSETVQRIKMVVTNPPKISWDILCQIQLMKECKIEVNVRDRTILLDFYKEGSTPRKKKRKRGHEEAQHNFKVKVHKDDQKVVDRILNYICSLSDLCLFDVSCTKDTTYDLVLHNVESLPYTLLAKIKEALSSFVEDIEFDCPNQRVHFYIKRNDSL